MSATGRCTRIAQLIGAVFLALTSFLWGFTADVNDAVAAPPSGVLGDEDHRVPLEPDRWPWWSIGRLNRAGSGFCTATLIGPRHVLTAAHCLYDPRVQRWVAPEEIHFIAGYARGEFRAHAVGKAFTTAPDYAFDHAPGRADLSRDWAIVTLQEPIGLKPLAWQAVPADRLQGTLAGGELVRAGYGRDRPHLLAIHRKCSVTDSMAHGSVLLHLCDSAPGDSGSPLILFVKGEPTIIGIHVGILSGSKDRFGAAVPATAFDRAARQALRSE